MAGEGPMGARRAGVLLHVSSVPGGTLGDEAFAFVDFLADAGCTVWQVLPLVPPHEDDGSPYNAVSAMAGSPGLIDRSRPVARGDGPEPAFPEWCAAQADWLEPYVEFMALRELLERAPWFTWEPGLRDRDPDRVAEVLAERGSRLDALKHEQWVFARQWNELRAYAGSRGVLLFGDLPIFVSHDSADVWGSRDLFLLGAEGQPVTVTGCPPDYFAAEGQRWNNPHYDWSAMAADGFAWWRRRIARQRELFDLVRIDHFRGFEAAWHVPIGASAKEGWWVPGPGRDLLAALVETAGAGTLVAEDLGVITPAVDALRVEAGLPGMKVLQFAFDGSPDNPYLPAHHEEWSVVYTGTHDNDTTVGWWSSLPEEVSASVRALLPDPDEPMPWALVRLALSSTARLVVVPAQDLLGLDGRSRMNTPGTDSGNWAWRAEPGAFDAGLASGLRELVTRYGRLPSSPAPSS